MKSNKGCYGYFTQEKKRRLIITLIMFAIPLLIFLSGLLYFKSRENLCTIIAVVGCLPACKSMVGLIMVCMQKSIQAEEYEKIRSRGEGLRMVYELYLTSNEKSGYVDAFAICGNEVVGYTSSPKTDVSYVAGQAQKILHQNGYPVHVKILRELSPFLERLTSLNRNKEALNKDIVFTPDEKYPELSREDLIAHLLMAIAL